MKALLFNKKLYMGEMHIPRPQPELVLPISRSLSQESFVDYENLIPEGISSLKMVYRLVDGGQKYAIYELDGFTS